VTWAIVHGEDSWADLERLTPDERTAVDDVLVGWVTTGPARDQTRPLADLTLFEHHVADSVALTYIIDDRQHLVGILRIRRI
jgi:hypothetical protein